MNHALHIHLSSIAGVPADRWQNNRSHHSRVNESAHPSYDKAGVPANKRWSRQSKSPYADRCMRTGKWRNIRSWKGSAPVCFRLNFFFIQTSVIPGTVFVDHRSIFGSKRIVQRAEQPFFMSHRFRSIFACFLFADVLDIHLSPGVMY